MEKLSKIFLLSAVLIYLHGIEEIYGGFEHFDSFMQFGASVFHTSSEVFYWGFHIIWWLLVPLIYLCVFKFHKTKNILLLFSLVYFLEIHHVIKAFVRMEYYPGMITALFYPILGFLFIKEFVKINKVS